MVVVEAWSFFLVLASLSSGRRGSGSFGSTELFRRIKLPLFFFSDPDSDPLLAFGRPSVFAALVLAGSDLVCFSWCLSMCDCSYMLVSVVFLCSKGFVGVVWLASFWFVSRFTVVGPPHWLLAQAGAV